MRLLLIDPQVDFCSPDGALFVPGADADMARLARWMLDNLDDIDDIDVSLDSHHLVDIAHPSWWCDSEGRPPAPFTPITAQDVSSGRWRCRQPSRTDQTLHYLEALEKSGRFPHLVWPPHCLIGTPGHCVSAEVHQALMAWETLHHRPVHYLLKGEHIWTEHFSAVGAEVPDPDRPQDVADPAWLEELGRTENLVIAGEALSHCVANTVRDLVSAVPMLAGRITLLTDATSSVAGFEHIGREFIDELTAKGMLTARCEPVDPPR